MSEFKVEVVKVSEVYKHPNADRLEIIHLENMRYICISAKGNFKVGDKAFYFPVDSVIPEKYVREFGIEKFYKKRLRATKLRGIFSEGLLIHCPPRLEVGEDCTEQFGVIKYETVIPESMRGEPESEIGQHKFEAPENYKKYSHLLNSDTRIAITEKIHGTNFVLHFDENRTPHVGSRNYFWKLDSDKNKGNIYIKAFNTFKELHELPPNTTVYGEIYGIQDLKYGLSPGEIDYAIFAVKQKCYPNREGYLGRVDFESFTTWYELKTAPLLYHGLYSDEVIQSFNNKDSTICPGQLMEGIVIENIPSDNVLNLNRICLKFISDRYQLRKSGTELH